MTSATRPPAIGTGAAAGIGDERAQRCAARGVAGPVAGKPKKLCKQCDFQFTRTTPRGKPLTMKINAVRWYLSGVSMHRIAFLLQVSAQAVLNWIRAFATAHPEKPEPTREPLSSRWMRCGTT